MSVLDVMLADAEAAMTMRGIVTGEGTEVVARKASDDARAAIAELLSAGDFMASNPIGMLTDGAINRWNRAAKAVRGGA